MKMNKARAKELIVPLKQGTADGISHEWTLRLIEALEYVIENENHRTAHELSPQFRKAWKVILCNTELGKKLKIEDDSIFTVDGVEVLGVSEWIRCEIDTLEHIVELHNQSLAGSESE